MRFRILCLWLRLAALSLVRQRRRTLITACSIAVGVALLTLLAALMVGINDTMIANALGAHTGHLLVTGGSGAGHARWRAERMDLPRGIEGILPRVSGTAIVSTETASAPVRLWGVVPESETVFTAVPRKMAAGRYLRSRSEVVLGDRVSEVLGCRAGDTVEVRVPPSDRSIRLTVAGVYRTGIAPLDEAAAYATLEDVQALLGERAAFEVALFLAARSDLKATAAGVAQVLAPGEELKTWPELLPDVVQLTELNRLSMLIVMVLALLLVGFGVANTVLLSVTERTREFGVLMTLGARPGGIVFLILSETALLSVMAASVGVALGSLAAWLVARHGIDLAALTSYNRYFVMTSVVRPRLDRYAALLPFVVAILSSLAAGVIPARLAGRRAIADCLRSV